jgi:acetyl esterase/lipase
MAVTPSRNASRRCIYKFFPLKYPQVLRKFGGHHEAIVATAFADDWRNARARGNGILSGLSTSITAPYRIVPNITYVTANNFEAKLDVYSRTDTQVPQPTIIFMHGGGWTIGAKETETFNLIPYLEMGWNAVNVEYRLAHVSHAPAAIEDCLCALRWVIQNAKQYGFDPTKLVVSGRSAGAHLALTTGTIPASPASAGLDRQCPGTEELKVAAIVDWYGITNVADLVDGPNLRPWAVQWLGSVVNPNRKEIADRASPLTYVRPGIPPIISIHADPDPVVPYTQSVQLHRALDGVVDHELVTISTMPPGKHGNFTRRENQNAFAAIKAFLGKHGLAPSAVSANP